MSKSDISALLLVTTRNLSEPTGEWRLIANRSAALRSEFGIVTDVVYLRPSARDLMPLNSLRWYNNLELIHFPSRINFRLVAAIFKLRKSVRSWLQRNPRGHVVISGFQSYFVPLGIPSGRTIIDLHGTLDEWIEGEGRSCRDLVLRMAYPLASLAEKYALNGAGGAFVVSNTLGEYAARLGTQKVWKIPCGLYGHSSRFDIGVAREEWRKRFSIESRTTVFVYSGGLSRWQCVRDAIRLFGQVKERWPGPCRLIIMTPRTELLDPVVADLNIADVSTHAVPANEVTAALSACDIGLLLREDKRTNHNAFPNKFAEYVAAGLFLITSPGLRDPSEFVVRHHFGVLIDPYEVRQGLSSERISYLIATFLNRGPYHEFSVRSQMAALDELRMEHLVGPFAESLTSS